MSQLEIPIRLIQTLGISSSLILSGFNITLSTSLIPRLLESPTPLLLKQWLAAYNQGKAWAPKIALLSLLSFGYLAYLHQPVRPDKGYAYATAGLLAVSIAPYTALVMGATNNKLMVKEEEVRALGKDDKVVEVGLGGETAHSLADWWAVLNLGRGALLASSGLLGLWTALH